MKTDILFYELFRVFPDVFFELIGEPAEAAEGYRFSSVEIKQTAYRLDGVFSPPDESLEKPIYFAEVQFQRNPKFYRRLFAEVFVYLDRAPIESDWRAVALFAKRSLDPGLTIQHQSAAEGHLIVRYLDEIEWPEDLSAGNGILELIVAPDETALERGRELFQRLEEETASGVSKQEIIKMVETVLVYKFPSMSRKEIQAMFPINDIRKSKVYQEALQEGKKAGKRAGKREGELKGKREGELKGKLEGKLEAVPLLMRQGMSVEQIAREFGVDVDAVRKVADQPGAAPSGRLS